MRSSVSLVLAGTALLLPACASTPRARSAEPVAVIALEPWRTRWALTAAVGGVPRRYLFDTGGDGAHRHGEAQPRDSALDGIVALDVFADRAVTLDLAAGRIVVESEASLAERVREGSLSA